VGWEWDLDTAWAEAKLMTKTARTVTWESFPNARVLALLALVGEFGSLLCPFSLSEINFHLLSRVISILDIYYLLRIYKPRKPLVGFITSKFQFRNALFQLP